MEPQEITTTYNAFLDRLSLDDTQRLDQSFADLDTITRTSDFMQHSRDDREQWVKNYLQHQVTPMKDVYSGLAPVEDNALGDHILEQVLGPRTWAETAGRKIHSIGTPIATMVGAAKGAGTSGSVPGAIIGGALGYLGADLALRQQTSLPAPTFGEQAFNTAMEGLTQGADQGVFNLLTKFGRHLIGGYIPEKLLGANFRPTPEEQTTMGVLREGSEALGTANTGAEGMITPGQIMQYRGTPNTGTFIENLMRNSFGGRNLGAQQITNARRAIEAMTTKYVNTLEAINDPRTAATTVVNAIKQRTQLAAQARRSLYQTFGTMTRDIPPQNTDDILSITSQKTRQDIIALHDLMNKDIPETMAENLDDLLTTKITAPFTTLPAGTVVPNGPVTYQGSPAIYQGPGPNPETSMIIVPELSANPIPVPNADITATITRNEASYANLDRFSSLMGGIVRAGEDAIKKEGRGSRAEDIIAASRTANYLKRMADRSLEGVDIPREVAESREILRKIYREENETFYTPLIQGLVAKFKDSPDTFAAEMIHPNNSDDLAKIRKAVEAMPRFDTTTLTSPFQRSVALRADTQYMRGDEYWNQIIRPQMQVEFIKPHIMSPAPGVSGNVHSWERAVGTPPAQMTGDTLKDALFSVNGQKLLTSLNAMTPATRTEVFRTEEHFNNLYKLAEALRQTGTSLGDAGSMLMPVRQSGAATTLAGAAGGMVAGTATGSPAIVGSLASMTIVLPYVIADKLTDAAFMRRLLFGVKNPGTGTASRVFAEMSKDAARLGTAFVTDTAMDQSNSQPLEDIP